MPTVRTKFGKGYITVPDGAEFVPIRLKSANKVINVPIDVVQQVDELGLRQYAFQSGQVDSQKAAGLSDEYSPVDPGTPPTAAALIGMGRRVKRTGNEIGKLFGQEGAQANLDEINRQAGPIRQASPAGSFIGENVLPEFAVPGGRFPQALAGGAEGVLAGESPLERIGLGVTGALLGERGAALGQRLGQSTRSGIQTLAGDADAGARTAVRGAGVPLSLSQQLTRPGQGMRSVVGGSLSRPLTRFFERTKFVFTGDQPLGPQQQAAMNTALLDVFGVNTRRFPRFTREALSEANQQIRPVFENAARRAAVESGGYVRFAGPEVQQANQALRAFNATDTDSNVVRRAVERAHNAIQSGQVLPDELLQIRKALSLATTADAAGPNIPQLVGMIDVIDDSLARQAPGIANELTTARERFRLMLALRRGAALSPDGSLNVPTFTKNLERVFDGFDIGRPLPGSLRNTGEAIAGFNQILDPMRSSGTAENLAAIGGDQGLARKVLFPLAAVSGGGLGGLLGGGASRSLLSPLDMLLQTEPINPLDDL